MHGASNEPGNPQAEASERDYKYPFLRLCFTMAPTLCLLVKRTQSKKNTEDNKRLFVLTFILVL